LQRSCWRFPTPLRTWGEALGLTRVLRRRSDYGEWDYATERCVDFAIGACLLLRRSALRECGLFDEGYFMYAEEIDLCRRLDHAGWTTVFTPTCTVLHMGGGSGQGETSTLFLQARARYFFKWYGAAGVATLRAGVGCGAVLRLIGFGLADLPGRDNRGYQRTRLRRLASELCWAWRPSSFASDARHVTALETALGTNSPQGPIGEWW